MCDGAVRAVIVPSFALNLVLLKQFNIQTNGVHKQVDRSQPGRCHGARKGLCVGNSVENTILDSKNQALLLLRVGTDTHGSKKLPDDNILSGVDAAREDMMQSRLQDVEEEVEGLLPMSVLVDVFNLDLDVLTIRPKAEGCLHRLA